MLSKHIGRGSRYGKLAQVVSRIALEKRRARLMFDQSLRGADARAQTRQITPQALANSSPGLERAARQPWERHLDFQINPERARQERNPFRVQRIFFIRTQGSHAVRTLG